jgi:hypothetical protein
MEVEEQNGVRNMSVADELHLHNNAIYLRMERESRHLEL